MKAKDIMSIHVITVAPDTTVQEIARRLLQYQVSAAPVVDAHERVVGMVSEGDLMRRVEAGTEKRRSWWLRHFVDPTVLSKEYTKAHARLARDVMTGDVVTVTPETSAAEIAELIERRRIKRVPVVSDGKLVGIVSRANLLHALVSMRKVEEQPTPSDRTIRERILEALEHEDWAEPLMTNVVVKEGVVELWGGVNSEEEKQAGRVLAENVAGVKRVDDRRFIMPLRWAYD
jgi:CBS domain-containing protein